MVQCTEFVAVCRAMLRLCILSSLVLLFGCDKSPTALERVQERGQLVVATRFGATTYYEGAEGSTGLEYDLTRMFANQLGVDLKLRVAGSFPDILTWVMDDEVDLAAAGLTVTRERKKRMRFGPSYQTVTAQLVRRLNHSTPKNLGELSGRMEVVAASSHVEYLKTERQRYPGLEWTEATDLDPESLMYLVSEQKIDYTVADSNDVIINRRLFPNLKVAFDIGPAQPLAWAFPRNTDTSLLDEATAFFTRIHTDGTLERLMDRYYGHIPEFDYVDTRTYLGQIRSVLPKYQALFEEGGKISKEDWRLLAAIGYQESHWNKNAVSPTGVRGIMMLTRNTMRHLKLSSRKDPKQSIIGGARYFAMTKKKVPDRIQEPDRTWLALAAYNIGFGHLEDARKLTQLNGGDPDKWIDVKEQLPLLSQSKWYRRTRHGFARGQASVQYVENIRGYYDVLLWVTHRNENFARKLAKKAEAAL